MSLNARLLVSLFLMMLLGAGCGAGSVDLGDPDSDGDALKGGIAPCNAHRATECCGNNVCEAREVCDNCAQDCGACAPTCGDGLCDAAEDCQGCPQDCGACVPTCGDGLCDGDEDCQSCVPDCGECTSDGCPGWSSQDIGTVAAPGSTTCLGDGSHSLSTSGGDIWGAADSFHFQYQTLLGDGAITARVVSHTETAAWSKAGVMMRETLLANSRHAHVLVSASPLNPVKLDRREVTGGNTTGVNGSVAAAPHWIRLERRGSLFIGFESPDGQNWSRIGSVTLSLPTTLYVGLSLNANNTSQTATAVFDHVLVQPGTAACFIAAECQDEDPCTADSCSEAGECLHASISECQPPPSGPLRVFPGAEGFGIETPAGRGGAILKVTNLNNSGAGSLRAALLATGPRTVVFEVSGTIALTSPIYVTAPYVTVAGQTAPSPGINIRDYGINIRTHDVLIQHLRMRMGDRYTDVVGPIYIQYYPNKNVVYNVVIDHCSISWGRDDCITFHYHMHDLTLSHSIISEGLEYDAGVSRGILVSAWVKNISLVKNLVTSQKRRFPEVNIGSELVQVNNLGYNGGKSNGWVTVVENLTENPNGDPLKVTSENNQFINGPNSVYNQSPYYISSSISSTSQLHISGTAYNGANPVVTNYKGSGVLVDFRPVWHDSIRLLPTADVYDYVLTNAGARPADRDAVDVRIVDEVRTGRGSWKSSVAAAGGHPTLAVNTRSLDVGANPNGDDDGDGYTNLEELLHQMAAQVEGR